VEEKAQALEQRDQALLQVKEMQKKLDKYKLLAKQKSELVE